MTFQEVVHSAQTAANSREDGVSTLPQHGPEVAACRCLVAHLTHHITIAIPRDVRSRSLALAMSLGQSC
jgi:hypothetical protein